MAAEDLKRKAEEPGDEDQQASKKKMADFTTQNEPSFLPESHNGSNAEAVADFTSETTAANTNIPIPSEAISSNGETEPEAEAPTAATDETLPTTEQDTGAITSDTKTETQDEPATAESESVEQPDLQKINETAETAAPIPSKETVVPFNRLIVLNLEATCDENPTNPAAVQVTKENGEVIELSFVILNAATMEVLHKQRIYVKPKNTPLTKFCSSITGITEEQLKSAGSLEDAVHILDQYVQTEFVAKGLNFCLVSHGAWAPRIQLPREARDKGIKLPEYLALCMMFDVKQEVQRWQAHHEGTHLQSMSLESLCDSFHVDRVESEEGGLNNCLTIVNIVRYLTEFDHQDVFVHPIDMAADLNCFKKEESIAIHLDGLPSGVTQGELEAWFSSNGLRPADMWMVVQTDRTKRSTSGFVKFRQHGDAMAALSLHGRCLGDRAISVSPSSELIINVAQRQRSLVKFPAQAKSRTRPGDWTCPSCSFDNFASRANCFQCKAENPSPSAIASNSSHPSSFAANDWRCQCGFNNFASRKQCFKCGAGRTGGAGGPGGYMGGAPPSMGGGGYGRPPAPSVRPGDWFCPNPSCGFQNFASRSSCFRCKTPSPISPHGSYASSSSGYGYSAEPSYGSSNSGGYGGGGNGGGGGSGYGGGYGGGYGSQPVRGGPPAGGATAQFRPGDWICQNQNCNAHNFASRLQCMACSSAKPYMASNPGMKPGDWTCDACQFYNYSWRDACNQCKAPKLSAPDGGYSTGY